MMSSGQLGHGIPVGHITGGQLLPSEIAKLDNLQEEVCLESDMKVLMLYRVKNLIKRDDV